MRLRHLGLDLSRGPSALTGIDELRRAGQLGLREQRLELFDAERAGRAGALGTRGLGRDAERCRHPVTDNVVTVRRTCDSENAGRKSDADPDANRDAQRASHHRPPPPPGRRARTTSSAASSSANRARVRVRWPSAPRGDRPLWLRLEQMRELPEPRLRRASVGRGLQRLVVRCLEDGPGAAPPPSARLPELEDPPRSQCPTRRARAPRRPPPRLALPPPLALRVLRARPCVPDRFLRPRRRRWRRDRRPPPSGSS